METNCIISIFKTKKVSISQGNMILNKNIHFMGPLVYVLPRARPPNSLETALSSHAKLEGQSSRKNVVSLNTLGYYCKGTNNSFNEIP